MALCVAALASAAAADPAEVVRRAADACAAADAEAACAALPEAEAALAEALGAGHPFVAMAAGRRAELCGGAVAKPGRAGPPKRPAPALAREVRRLAACEALASKPAGGSDFADRYRAARDHYEAGRLDEARAEADRAARLARGELDPRRIAESQELVATIAWAEGHGAKALAAAQDAAGAATQSGDADIRIRMARLVARVGDLGFADELLAALDAERLPAGVAGELALARGDVDLRVGRTARAAATLERAVELHRASLGAKHVQTAAALQLLGDAQRQSANYPAARASYDEALAIRKQILDADDPALAETWNALGVLRADFDDWSAGDAAFREASAILVEAYGPEHPETLRVALNRGRARWGVQPDAKSLAAYAQAVERLSGALSDRHAGVAPALRNLARMHADLGELSKAESLYARTLAAQEQALGAVHPETSLTRLERARVLGRRGRLADAAGEIRRATGQLAEGLGDDHPLLAQYRTELARVELARGRPGAARSEALEAGRVLALHLERSFGAMSDRQRRALADRSQAVIGVLLSLPDDRPGEVYEALLPHRDSVVRSIAESQARARTGRGEGSALLDELVGKRERYAASLLDADPSRARRLAREIDALEAKAAAAGVAPPRAAGSAARVVARACERLPADASLYELVEYDHTARGSLESTPRYVGFVVRGGGCEVRALRLGAAAPILQSAARFGEAMRASQNDAEAARADLAKRLLAPARSALGGVDRWLVVPDAGLWGVPFGALPDPEAPGSYLLERVVVGYLTSIHELADGDAAGGGAALGDALVLGAPDFGAASGKGPVVLTGSGPCRLPPFDPLPGTEAEARDVAERLGQARLLLGNEASKEGLRRALAKGPDLVHLATHGYFASLEGGCQAVPGRSDRADRSVSPGEQTALDPLLLSGIVLARANDGPGRDGSNGILTSSEVTKLDLRTARLVVLSACDSGTGSRQRGQELQGLRFAFRAAGAGSLVTSLWRSNDRVTQAMMSGFYQALGAGDLPTDVFRGAEALRRAKLERIARDSRLGLKRPLTWANFVFSGVL